MLLSDNIPSGSGKSWILLLTYLCCLVVEHTNNQEDWLDCRYAQTQTSVKTRRSVQDTKRKKPKFLLPNVFWKMSSHRSLNPHFQWWMGTGKVTTLGIGLLMELDSCVEARPYFACPYNKSQFTNYSSSCSSFQFNSIISKSILRLLKKLARGFYAPYGRRTV